MKTESLNLKEVIDSYRSGEQPITDRINESVERNFPSLSCGDLSDASIRKVVEYSFSTLDGKVLPLEKW